MKVPLARIAHTRSGDKGGNANVGVWVRSVSKLGRSDALGIA